MTWSGTTAGQPTAPSRIASSGRSTLEKIVRHDLAVLLPMLDAPRQVRVVEREALIELLHAIEHADRFGGDFDPDAVAGKNCDLETFHGLEGTGD